MSAISLLGIGISQRRTKPALCFSFACRIVKMSVHPPRSDHWRSPADAKSVPTPVTTAECELPAAAAVTLAPPSSTGPTRSTSNTCLAASSLWPSPPKETLSPGVQPPSRRHSHRVGLPGRQGHATLAPESPDLHLPRRPLVFQIVVCQLPKLAEARCKRAQPRSAPFCARIDRGHHYGPLAVEPYRWHQPRRKLVLRMPVGPAAGHLARQKFVDAPPSVTAAAWDAPQATISTASPLNSARSSRVCVVRLPSLPSSSCPHHPKPHTIGRPASVTVPVRLRCPFRAGLPRPGSTRTGNRARRLQRCGSQPRGCDGNFPSFLGPRSLIPRFACTLKTLSFFFFPGGWLTCH